MFLMLIKTPYTKNICKDKEKKMHQESINIELVNFNKNFFCTCGYYALSKSNKK